MPKINGTNSLLLVTTCLLLTACGGSSNPPQQSQQSQQSATDPLYQYQWHLKNTGQPVFGNIPAVAGIDLNIGDLHEQGIRGDGVQVAVIDSGLDIKHEDLANNVEPGRSYNFLDPTISDPTSTSTGGDHGTSVAGIIGAVGWNNKGGRGVAPNVRLRGINYLATKNGEDLTQSLGALPQAAEAGILNLSLGRSLRAFEAVSDESLTAQEKLLRSLRNGKGGVYVKSAGNYFNNIPSTPPDPSICADAVKYNISCHLPGTESFNSLHEVITVAAVNAQGQKSSYSSAGSVLWVSGLGGEYGYQRQFFTNPLASTIPNDHSTWKPAIVTTDQSGCSAGYNSDRADNHSVPANGLDRGSKSTIDASCNYTALMNGTSAAAPTVSGVVALMLQVNPNLTQRDVKYILAATARKIDPNQPVVSYKNIVLDPGWVTNAAGRSFSNWYGFGLVDASKAVAMAKQFVSLSALKDTGWLLEVLGDENNPGIPIPYLDETKGLASMTVADNIKVETVQLSLFTSHTTPKDLRIVLISPSGTKSTIVTPFSGLLPAGDESEEDSGFIIPFTATNAFLDENSKGTWTIQVLDVNNNSVSAYIQAFRLRILGS